MRSKSVQYVIWVMTLFNLSATPGIVTTRIGWNDDLRAGCPCGGVDWISGRRRDTEFGLRNGYHSRSSLIIPEPCSVPDWPTLHGYSSTKSTAVTPLQLSQSATCISFISNNSSFRQKHPGVPDGSDSSDGTSYPLTGNYTLLVAQVTARVAYIPLPVFTGLM